VIQWISRCGARSLRFDRDAHDITGPCTPLISHLDTGPRAVLDLERCSPATSRWIDQIFTRLRGRFAKKRGELIRQPNSFCARVLSSTSTSTSTSVPMRSRPSFDGPT
jgi:hypothetical protein